MWTVLPLQASKPVCVSCIDFGAFPSIQRRRGDLGWNSSSVSQSFAVSGRWGLPGQLLAFTPGECCVMVSLLLSSRAGARGSGANIAVC